MDIEYGDNFMVCILVLNAVILMYSSVVGYKSLPNVSYTRVYQEGFSYPIPIALGFFGVFFVFFLLIQLSLIQ